MWECGWCVVVVRCRWLAWWGEGVRDEGGEEVDGGGHGALGALGKKLVVLLPHPLVVEQLVQLHCWVLRVAELQSREATQVLQLLVLDVCVQSWDAVAPQHRVLVCVRGRPGRSQRECDGGLKRFALRLGEAVAPNTLCSSRMRARRMFAPAAYDGGLWRSGVDGGGGDACGGGAGFHLHPLDVLLPAQVVGECEAEVLVVVCDGHGVAAQLHVGVVGVEVLEAAVEDDDLCLLLSEAHA